MKATIRQPSIPKKTCKDCGGEYPATPDYFYRNNHLKSGLFTRCKPCAEKVITRKKPQKNTQKSSNGIVSVCFKCRRCGKPTDYKYVAEKDIERLSDKFLCSKCKNLADEVNDGTAVFAG